MKIGFFEVEKWAETLIKDHFPDADIYPEKLLPENAKNYKNLEVISPFIYSSLNKSTLLQLPNIKLISTRSTGFDHIDIDYCKQRGIKVSNVPTYGERTVAEHTFGLILTLTRKLYSSIERTKKGDFTNAGLRGVDVLGKTIGIIGLGHIGLEVMKIARGFEMNILIYTHTKHRELEEQYGFKYCELDFLLSRADVISLHLPLTKATRHIINKENIVKMKKGSFLVNTSRGGLIEVEALLVALEKEILEGVGLDVLEEERVLREEAELLSSEFRKRVNYENLAYNHILAKHPKVIITPHNAFNSKEALERILLTTIFNINSYLKDAPQNIIA
ncbi:MAG: NAD(P)-dependent oxidoreductase [Candidatus Paceibacterota bacterium]